MTDARELESTSFEEIVKRFPCKSSSIKGMALIVRRCAAQQGNTLSTLESMVIADKRLIRCIQKEKFSDPSPSLRNVFKQLDCFTDDSGILRVGGRSSKSLDSWECKHPILLLSYSHYALLTARHCHKKVAHQGRTSTINEIRSGGHWILGVRRVVSSIIKCCTTCLRFRDRPRGQMMADLPVERVEPAAPFTYCGLDCFGPFHVKDGRREVKRYGLIVTCLASRAIHIELLEDMTTNAFVNGLRNVIAIRGDIRMIRCDQGTNFVGASREFKLAMREMNTDNIVNEMVKLNCEFVFNPPASSHMGGVWERQIRTVRNVLNGIVKRSGSRLTTASLRTLFYEAMAVVNSRPLSVESLESPTDPRPLTPNHILTMKSSGICPPPGVFDDASLYVRQRWRCVQSLADEFWQRWRKEYLSPLQRRRKWQTPQQNAEVGDVVCLHDVATCRGDWKTARVIEVFPSDDGLVRSVKLRMATSALDKNGRPTGASVILTRPVHKLTVMIKHAS